jgi:hypothetical protein
MNIQEKTIVNKIRIISVREAAQDLYDIGILFNDYFTIEDFKKFYKIAMKKEDNLKDFLYIYGTLKYATEAIKNNKNDLLLKEDTNFNQNLEKLNETFEKLADNLIEINNNLYKNSNKLKL